MKAGLEADLGLVVLEALVGAGSCDAHVGGVVSVVIASTACPGAEGSEGIGVVVSGTVAGSHTEASHGVAEEIIGN